MIKWLKRRAEAKLKAEEQKLKEKQRLREEEQKLREQDIRKKNELTYRLNISLKNRIQQIKLEDNKTLDEKIKKSILKHFQLIKKPLHIFAISIGQTLEQDKEQKDPYQCCTISEYDIAELFRDIWEIVCENKNIYTSNGISGSKELYTLIEEYAEMCGHSLTYIKTIKLGKKFYPSTVSNMKNYIEEIQRDIYLYMVEEFIGCNSLLDFVNFKYFSLDELYDQMKNIEEIKHDVSSAHGFRQGQLSIYSAKGRIGRLFVYLISLSMYIKIIEIAEEVVYNEDLMKMFRDREIDTDKIYDIYKNLYIDTIEYKLDIKYFRILRVILIIKDMYKENYKPNTYEILNTIKMDQDIGSKNIYRFMDNTFLNDKFIEVIYKKHISTEFILTLPKWILEKIDVRDWLITLPNYYNSIQKIEAYSNKYKILKEPISNPCIIEENKFVYEDDLKYKDDESGLLQRFKNIQTGREFEEFLETFYKEMGYVVILTPETNDQGADLIIEKNNKKTVIQAKFYSTPVGNSSVQQVVAAIKYYNADKGMVVTNNTFTKSAKELARVNDIKLITGELLENMLENFLE